MQASSLKEAIANLNEQSALIFNAGEDIPKSASAEFYVDRPENPLEELKTYLINSPADDKILFTGHLGSGKSTELNRFAADDEINQNFFVLKYSISEVLNILDIDYIDFLLSFTACLYTKAAQEGLTFDEKTNKLVLQWIDYFKSDTKELEKIDESKTKAKRISTFFKNVITILLRELTLRDKIREAVKRNITQLVNVINALVTQIKVRLEEGKELLIIIDDLEKIPDVSRAGLLFNQAGTYMTTPKCKIIYTVPIALYYSLQFQQMASIFSERYCLPNIKVWDKDDKETVDPTGIMRSFLSKRMIEKLIEEDAIKLAIISSAGVAREFVRILKMASIKAMTKKRDVISKDIVSSVIEDLRGEFTRGMEKRHYIVLKCIAQNEPVDDQHTMMELFHSKVVLEYKNGEQWTAITPIIQPPFKYQP